ncbi:MAG: hypothetical protein Kow0089_13070 [Desulfobulbaceae bacterium]
MSLKNLLTRILLAILVLAVPSVCAAGKFRNGGWKARGDAVRAQAGHDGRGNSMEVKSGRKGRVSGTLVFENATGVSEAMEGCKVCFFDEREGPVPGYGSRWWRIPDFEYASLVGSDGAFDAEVPEGEYVVASVERLSPDEDFGPPLPGEKVFISEKIRVEPHAKKDLGLRKARPHPERPGRAGERNSPETVASIEGFLLDETGAPFRGGFVVAYPYGFLSKRTGSDGRFTLFVPEGGRYRLVARNVYGFT